MLLKERARKKEYHQQQRELKLANRQLLNIPEETLTVGEGERVNNSVMKETLQHQYYPLDEVAGAFHQIKNVFGEHDRGIREHNQWLGQTHTSSLGESQYKYQHLSTASYQSQRLPSWRESVKALFLKK